MNDLLEILEDLHDDVDYATCENLIDAKILDSFDIISLISEIENTFGVLVTAEHMTAENFNSAQKIYELIQKLEDE